MKQKAILLFASVLTLTLFSACDNKDKDPGFPDENGGTVAAGPAIDLSEKGMANCYIVQTAGHYKFPADNQFNLGASLPVPPELHPSSATLIWQTDKGLISNVTLKDEEGTPYVDFIVNTPIGNAVIGVSDDTGEIIWSWHIWMPVEEVNSVKGWNGHEVMNLNLGALNNNPGDVDSYGMLYQWGRKDPFPASPTLTGTTSTLPRIVYDEGGKMVSMSNSSWYDTNANTLEYAIAHPTVVLSNYSQYSESRDWLVPAESDDSLWGNPEGDARATGTGKFINQGVKTCYDPSPAGWRVAPADTFENFTKTGNFSFNPDEFNVADCNNDGEITIDDYNYGWYFRMDGNDYLYFPAAARYDGSYAMLMGSVSGIWGNYWSNSPYSGREGAAFSALAFQVKDQNGAEMITVSPAAAASRADAFSIRCVRDE
ncbi:MAG: hypothetical protein J1F16_05825 [Muribaculaceae bacterium]|nr:hypothetical protein [Muribaculaceae bacterium]